MDFFEKYYSNTVAGSGPQSYFTDSCKKVKKGRLFYRIFKGGKYEYSILFSNTVDSTFSDGSYSCKNRACGTWKIHSMSLGIAHSAGSEEFGKISSFKTVYIDGKKEKQVVQGEIFNTDPVEICAEEGDYLCLQIEFSGAEIPNHPESMIPSFLYNGSDWKRSTDIPYPSSIGCDRLIKRKIVYLGDSITQGIGVGINKYTFWNYLLSEKLGKENGYWNLGLGYGRANDAASDGVWLNKAKKADYVFLCYGVNDINIGGFSSENIKNNLKKIVDLLHKAGCKVLVQTVPPADYKDEKVKVWEDVNEFILSNSELSADEVFDCVPYLYLSRKEPYKSAIGNVHPDAEHSEKWAEALFPVAKKFIEEK